MPGSAIVSPASFGDTSLPRLDLRPMTAIAGAAYDWASDRLNSGPLEFWYDMVQNVPFVAPGSPSQKPLVYESNRKVVRFNGVNQRMDADIQLTGPATMVLVGRLPVADNSQYILTGGTGPAFHVYRGGNGNWATFAGSTLGHTSAADTSFHIIIVVRDGVNSVLNVDGVDVIGDMGPLIAERLRLGGSSSAYFQTDIQRLALLPFAATQKQREALVAQMRAAYKL